MNTTTEILEAKVRTYQSDALYLHQQARELERRGEIVAANEARASSRAKRGAALTCTADLLALGAW